MADEQPGFFNRVGGTLSALLGLNAASERGYTEGLRERTAADYAMERARSQREDTRRKAAERAIEETRARAYNDVYGYDFTQEGAYENPAIAGALITSGLGNEFAGLGLGRLRGQEHRFREGLADPTLGDAARLGYAEALAPSSSVNQRLGALLEPDPGPLEIVDTPEGPRYAPRADAVAQPPGTRPSSSSTRSLADIAQQQLMETIASELAYRTQLKPHEPDYLAPEEATAELRRILENVSQPVSQPGPSASPAPLAAAPNDGIPTLGPNDQILYERLPPGTRFRAPDGTIREKP